MSAAVKRLAVRGKSGNSSAQRTSSNISNFARVSKAIGDSKLDKDIAPISVPVVTPSSRKRKARETAQDDDSSADELPVRAQTTTITNIQNRTIVPAVKRGRGRPSKKSRPAQPSLKRARSPSVSDSEQSTVDADKLFKRLRLESSPSRSSSPLTATTSAADSDTDLSSVSTLPDDILNLVDLNASFLRTLTLHFVHNGQNVPVDLRTLCPHVARAWGRRGVTEDDIGMCVAVLTINSKTPIFALSNYGRGKICLEVDQNRAHGPLDEKQLNNTFYANIENLWARFSSNDINSSSEIARFVNTLPKAAVTVCEAIAKAAPVLTKGQRRLEEFKQGIAARKLEKAAASTPPAVTASSSVPTPAKPAAAKVSLLDRIRSKQLAKAAMPPGLSPAEIERRAALQRAPDVAALLSMLSNASAAGQGRISFPMSLVLEKLKDSLRMGISREEGATCVRLMAKEVAPEWIVVVTVAGRENVVVETDRVMSKGEIERRVNSLVTAA
ncbi:hypothetical protein BX600DRAFT_457856 [Xylariales sp. PMI_506]|nr:hypothetical protein BX600DRAFT_457856 [Xylariales sp. PMI_506]